MYINDHALIGSKSVPFIDWKVIQNSKVYHLLVLTIYFKKNMYGYKLIILIWIIWSVGPFPCIVDCLDQGA